MQKTLRDCSPRVRNCAAILWRLGLVVRLVLLRPVHRVDGRVHRYQDEKEADADAESGHEAPAHVRDDHIEDEQQSRHDGVAHGVLVDDLLDGGHLMVLVPEIAMKAQNGDTDGDACDEKNDT
jgi:hypothetical protein